MSTWPKLQPPLPLQQSQQQSRDEEEEAGPHLRSSRHEDGGRSTDDSHPGSRTDSNTSLTSKASLGIPGRITSFFRRMLGGPGGLSSDAASTPPQVAPKPYRSLRSQALADEEDDKAGELISSVSHVSSVDASIGPSPSYMSDASQASFLQRMGELYGRMGELLIVRMGWVSCC
jgi:hypothetical protein